MSSMPSRLTEVGAGCPAQPSARAGSGKPSSAASASASLGGRDRLRIGGDDERAIPPARRGRRRARGRAAAPRAGRAPPRAASSRRGSPTVASTIRRARQHAPGGHGLAPLAVEGERLLERLQCLLEPALLLARPAPSARAATRARDGRRGRARAPWPGSARPGRRRARARARPPGPGSGSRSPRSSCASSALTGGANELERGQVVVGEHVGQVLGPLAGLPLEPGGRGAVPGGTRRRAGSARSRRP